DILTRFGADLTDLVSLRSDERIRLRRAGGRFSLPVVNAPRSRDEVFGRLAGRTWDILVIGGGITGCGIARDAALRGFEVALVEKEDLGAGTSSKSSKLVHGGLRYLERAELKLVFEGVNE